MEPVERCGLGVDGVDGDVGVEGDDGVVAGGDVVTPVDGGGIPLDGGGVQIDGGVGGAVS